MNGEQRHVVIAEGTIPMLANNRVNCFRDLAEACAVASGLVQSGEFTWAAVGTITASYKAAEVQVRGVRAEEVFPL